MDDTQKIELATQFECLAQDSAIRGARIEALYQRLRNDPKCCEALLGHVGRQIVDNDKLTIGLRTAASLVRNTRTYIDQAPRVIDQLLRSNELIRQSKNVVPFSQVQMDKAIGYLGIEDDTKGNPA